MFLCFGCRIAARRIGRNVQALRFIRRTLCSDTGQKLPGSGGNQSANVILDFCSCILCSIQALYFNFFFHSCVQFFWFDFQLSFISWNIVVCVGPMVYSFFFFLIYFLCKTVKMWVREGYFTEGILCICSCFFFVIFVFFNRWVWSYLVTGSSCFFNYSLHNISCNHLASRTSRESYSSTQYY